MGYLLTYILGLTACRWNISWDRSLSCISHCLHCNQHINHGGSKYAGTAVLLA